MMTNVSFFMDDRLMMAVFLALTLVFYFLNRRPRAVVDTAIKPGKIPERQFGYTLNDLELFRRTAMAVPTSFGQNALNIYRRIVLRIDLGFAICLALFSYIAWSCLPVDSNEIETPFHLISYIGRLMTIAYGVSDVAEDLTLCVILKPQRIMSGKEAALASLFNLRPIR